MRIRAGLIAVAAAAGIGLLASPPIQAAAAPPPLLLAASSQAAAQNDCPAAADLPDSASRPPSGTRAGTNASQKTNREAQAPSDVLDLANWYLTLPTGQAGKPDTVEQPALAKLNNQFFKLTPQRDGVEFSAPGNGVTTKNSKFPRSELREMMGDKKAAWSNTVGEHTLDVCEAFTQLPRAKPEVVGAQIHDADDDVLQIRLEGQKLMVQYDDGKSEKILDPAYKLGTPYHLRIAAAGSKVTVQYNGRQMAELPLKGSGWYWKVGAYVQSNASKGDAGSRGAVTVYSLTVRHTGEPRSGADEETRPTANDGPRTSNRPTAAATSAPREDSY